MDGDISPITSVDNLVLDQSDEEMEITTPKTVSTGTEIESADAALVTDMEKDRPKITIKKKQGSRDSSPFPEGTKEPFLEAKKWAEKSSRVQTLIEFLAPYIGGNVVPYITNITYKPKLGIEDETFVKLWDQATNKCSKWLMETSFNQAKLQLEKINVSYSEAIRILQRTAGPINAPQLMEKLATFKQEKFASFTQQRADKQDKYINPPPKKTTEKAVKLTLKVPTRGRSENKKLNKRKSGDKTSRSPSQEKLRTWRRECSNSTGKDKAVYRATNPNYRGKNFDPYYDGRGNSRPRSDSREKSTRRDRNADKPSRRDHDDRHASNPKKFRRDRRRSESDSDKSVSILN
jgi:hypothetical protein